MSQANVTALISENTRKDAIIEDLNKQVSALKSQLSQANKELEENDAAAKAYLNPAPVSTQG